LQPQVQYDLPPLPAQRQERQGVPHAIEKMHTPLPYVKQVSRGDD
jgi:hypothetical protein